MADIRCVADGHNKLGETPVWDMAEQALFWVDIEASTLFRLDPASGRMTDWHFPERIASFALRAQGGFIVALASTLALFDPTSGRLERLPRPAAHTEGNRFNDGKCDRAGRFWVGSMNDSLARRSGGLYRVDHDLTCTLIDEGIGISNSLAWSPDNERMYFADTLTRELYVYDYDLLTGIADNRRLFSNLAGQPGDPDGSTIDAEGFLWNAQWDGSRLVRYAPDGRIDRVVELPVQKPTSCAFGGADLATLYITSAVWDLSDAALAEQPQAGGVFAFEPGVRGLPEPRFAG